MSQMLTHLHCECDAPLNRCSAIRYLECSYNNKLGLLHMCSSVVLSTIQYRNCTGDVCSDEHLQRVWQE